MTVAYGILALLGFLLIVSGVYLIWDDNRRRRSDDPGAPTELTAFGVQLKTTSTGVVLCLVGAGTALLGFNKVEDSRSSDCRRVVDDDNPPLNVRAEPDASSESVATLENGTELTVTENRDGWFQISSPVDGYVFAANTDCE
jgi:hypothetical protein